MGKNRGKLSAFYLLLIVMLFLGNMPDASADVIIDNGGSGTSYSGTWKVSSAPNPYGSNSLWGSGTSTYTWKAGLQSGTYDVYMWWTAYSDRATDAPVKVTHSSGTQTIKVNQQQNGGKWNYLGTFSFGSSGTVQIAGTGSKSITVCADAVKFVSTSGSTPPPSSGDQTTEEIFFAPAYASKNAMTLMTNTLKNMGATLNNGVWTYVNTELNKKFLIYPVDTLAKWRNALKTQDAHILFFGHSNFGLGQVFATSEEFSSSTIKDIYYIDDDRIGNLSSRWNNVSVGGMRTNQAYPFWWPEFKDGTSGIMPYVFKDPRGNPAYNYYITYRVPGDSKYYKMETVRNSALERFPDSKRAAWYSSTGQEPDPSNSDHLKYFITNTAAWSPSIEITGDWIASLGVAGYYMEDYIYTPAGTGKKSVRWLYNLPKSGTYIVNAWWSASSARTPSAPYVISHAGGETTVRVDQRYNGGKWNRLGSFNFNSGKNSVLLTDQADPGNVVADAVKISHANNPADTINVSFYANVRSGPAPLEVSFVANETGDVFEWRWDYGDGYKYRKRSGGDTVKHTYTSPGTYTVTLTAIGPLGTATKTRTAYVTVGGSTPLQAEFRPPSKSSRVGAVPLSVSFTDISTGKIASWLWEFGDGSKSTSKSPSYTYSNPGNYTVKLTVTDSNGNKSTETKENIVRAVVFEKVIDNVDYPKKHYGSKTLVFRKGLEVPKDQMKFSRMLYTGCDSGHYYSDVFDRGIYFYATNSTGEGEIAMSEYLKAYVKGKSDYEIWKILQEIEPLYDYYNFNKLPSQQ